MVMNPTIVTWLHFLFSTLNSLNVESFLLLPDLVIESHNPTGGSEAMPPGGPEDRPSEYSLLEPISRPPVNCSCGQETEEIRYFKGRKVVRGDMPWLVRIFDQNKAENEFLCLGSLFNDRYALTAASCIFKYREDVGSLRVNLLGTDSASEIISVSKIKIYNGFNKYDKRFRHDIALVRLATKIHFTSEFPNPACIETHKSKLTAKPTGRGSMMDTVIWWKHRRREGYPWISFYGKSNIYTINDRICFYFYPDVNQTTICGRRHFNSKEENYLIKENSDYFCHIAPGTPLMKTHYGASRNSSVIVGIATKISTCSTLNSNGDINIFLPLQDYIPWIRKNSDDGTFCGGIYY